MLRQALQGYRQAARRPAFRRFWLGMMLSRAGDAFTVVALSWVVLGLSGPVQLGLVLMCFGLPRMASAPLAGHLLDRFRPGLLLAADNAARGLLIAAVPVLLWQHRLTVADLYGIAAACALLSPMTEVAEAALVPRLVADGHLDAANALLSANWEMAGIAGPAVAGLIVATVGAALALLLDEASFAVMAAICLNLPFRPPARRGIPAAGRRSRLGFGRISAVIVAGAPLFGLLRFAPDLAVAAVLLGPATFAWGPYYVFARTLMQRLVPEDVRSQAAGAQLTITSLGFPLGSAVGGAVISGIGVPAVIAAIACSYLALGLLPLLAPPLRATVEFTGATG